MSTTTDSGQDFRIYNLTLSTTTQQFIPNDDSINSMIIRSRNTEIDIHITKGGSGDRFTIPGGQSLTLDISLRSNESGVFLASASGTPVAEILVTYGG